MLKGSVTVFDRPALLASALSYINHRNLPEPSRSRPSGSSRRTRSQRTVGALLRPRVFFISTMPSDARRCSVRVRLFLGRLERRASSATDCGLRFYQEQELVMLLPEKSRISWTRRRCHSGFRLDGGGVCRGRRPSAQAAVGPDLDAQDVIFGHSTCSDRRFSRHVKKAGAGAAAGWRWRVRSRAVNLVNERGVAKDHSVAKRTARGCGSQPRKGRITRRRSRKGSLRTWPGERGPGGAWPSR